MAIAAHIPAIRALDDYELRAVSTSSRCRQMPPRQHSTSRLTTTTTSWVAHPGVDLVVVSVKVRHHHELVSAALAAGKMVLSEWPLGRNLEEARDLVARRAAWECARRSACRRASHRGPACAKLIREGYVGEVLATTLVGSGTAWGPETEHSRAYIFDAAEGASTLRCDAACDRRPELHAR
jgi:predicted dehydrogenase